MKSSSTKSLMKAFALSLCLITSCISYSQSVTTIESGNFGTALAKDANNNIYLARYNAGSNKYEIVKYTDGTGTPVTILPGLSYDAYDYVWGIAVAGNGDVYVAESNIDNKIVKLTYNSSNNSYTASDFTTGHYASALAIDADDNLYSCEFVESDSTYGVVKYTGGNTPGTLLFDGLQLAGSYPTGLAVAPNGDIYVTDGFDGQSGYFGGAYKVTAASGYNYGAKTIISSGAYSTALALDPQGNLYVSEYDGSTTFVLNKYTNATGTPATVQNLLINSGNFFPWGIVALSDNDIYFNTGDDDGNSGGSLMHYINTPDIQASNLTFNNITENSVAASWTNGNGSRRAVFIANITSGTPSPVNNVTYNANPVFESGSQIGASGWYCVYNGAGNTVDITGLTADSTYRMMVVEYNGNTGNEIYNLTANTNDPANVTASDPLSVKWISFDVKTSNNIYTWNWSLGTEENVNYYVPQYSEDGVHFKDAGKVEQSNDGHSYTFSKEIRLIGNVFFRVKEIDNDGKYAYSTIRSLTANESNSLLLYPNPASSTTYLQWPYRNAKKLQVAISDNAGKIVNRQEVSLKTGTVAPVNIMGLRSGIYFIRCMDDLQHSINISSPLVIGR